MYEQLECVGHNVGEKPNYSSNQVGGCVRYIVIYRVVSRVSTSLYLELSGKVAS